MGGRLCSADVPIETRDFVEPLGWRESVGIFRSEDSRMEPTRRIHNSPSLAPQPSWMSACSSRWSFAIVSPTNRKKAEFVKTVAVFGAGIAGLTVAHELARLGYKVFVYEANAEAGGFFRSARLRQKGNLPTEYSWHGFGPWYHNVFDLLKQIPFDETASLYDKALSRPIDFGLAPDQGPAAFDDTWLVNVKNMFKMTWGDVVRWGWLMLKTWTANRRTFEHYSRLNAAEQWRPLLTEKGWKTWRASFGPWIGSDWTNVSLHQCGQFFRKQLITKPAHPHEADGEGPEWRHGARDGWLLLRGPSNEIWFDKWIAHLKQSGVEFFWKESLHNFDFDGQCVTAAHLASRTVVQADIYVMATNPFAAADILKRTPELEKLDQLRLFRPLTQDGPHIQVSFRIAFSERMAWPRKRAGIIIADSEFNLTLFAQEQAWMHEVDLGAGVASLWTVTACVATVPGRLHGRSVVECTKEQFLEEVKGQILHCKGLNALIEEANGGRSLSEFPILKMEVWHEWQFSPQGLQFHQPKWVNTTTTQPHQPTQATPVPNLLLAGAHTKTEVDVWSIEAAVESGRRAAQVVEPHVKVLPQYKPLWLRTISAADDLCFAVGAPHVLDLLLAGVLIMVLAVIVMVLIR